MRILNLDDSYISHYGAYMTVRAFSVMDSFVKIKPAGGGLRVSTIGCYSFINSECDFCTEHRISI